MSNDNTHQKLKRFLDVFNRKRLDSLGFDSEVAGFFARINSLDQVGKSVEPDRPSCGLESMDSTFSLLGSDPLQFD